MDKTGLGPGLAWTAKGDGRPPDSAHDASYADDRLPRGARQHRWKKSVSQCVHTKWEAGLQRLAKTDPSHNFRQGRKWK